MCWSPGIANLILEEQPSRAEYIECAHPPLKTTGTAFTWIFMAVESTLHAPGGGVCWSLGIAIIISIQISNLCEWKRDMAREKKPNVKKMRLQLIFMVLMTLYEYNWTVKAHD